MKEYTVTLFKTFYNRYKHHVYFFVLKYIKNQQDVEDVVQDIFIHLWKHHSKLEENTLVESIIFKTAKQEIANFYRKNNHYLDSIEDIFSDIPAENPEASELREERLQELQELLLLLPEKNREFLLLNKIEKVSLAAIAEENQLSKSAVEKRVNKSLNFLKTKLPLILMICYGL